MHLAERGLEWRIMSISIPERIAAARAGTNPTVICQVPSGWAFLCDMQFLRGYVIHTADPVVASLNDLDVEQRKVYLGDMALIGDALLEVTGAYRINYMIAGNSDPYLHAHIIPRYQTEPEQYLRGLPWSYPKEQMDVTPFNAGRDRELIQEIAAGIKKRLNQLHTGN
jgi:diadenosine tetraphosphate (Ap4A) HIT family hydrolase